MVKLVDSITVDSSLFPAYTVNDPLGASTTQGDGWLLRWLKPRLIITSPLGVKTIAPYGTPTGTELNIVWQGLIVLLLLAAVIIIIKKRG